MIKLKQLISEGLKDMVFTKTIKPKHQKKMKREVKLFPPKVSLSGIKPPANDSQKTKSEIHYLLAYNDGVIDNKFVEKYDDTVKVFMEAIEKNNIDVKAEYLEQIIQDTAKYLFKLKYKYNRPRPFQIAEYYNIKDFKRHNLDTAKTPSYPSGHALQGRLIGLVLSKKDPKNTDEYMDIGKKVSESRIMGRVHYPSDKEYGEKLADELFRQMKGNE